MNFTGILIAISAFLIIGLFHPIVIKTEYYTGVRFWWIFLLMGLICLVSALYVNDTYFFFFTRSLRSIISLDNW